MDNFGIFKLLSSFYDFLGKSDTKNFAEGFSDRPIFETIKNAQRSPQASPTPSPAEVRATLPPLKISMLSTMSSHDAFVKRVKEKNK